MWLMTHIQEDASRLNVCLQMCVHVLCVAIDMLLTRTVVFVYMSVYCRLGLMTSDGSVVVVVIGGGDDNNCQ